MSIFLSLHPLQDETPHNGQDSRSAGIPTTRSRGNASILVVNCFLSPRVRLDWRSVLVLEMGLCKDSERPGEPLPHRRSPFSPGAISVGPFIFTR